MGNRKMKFTIKAFLLITVCLIAILSTIEANKSQKAHSHSNAHARKLLRRRWGFGGLKKLAGGLINKAKNAGAAIANKAKAAAEAAKRAAAAAAAKAKKIAAEAAAKAKGGLGKIGAGLKGLGAKAKGGLGGLGALGKGLLGKAKGGLGKIGAGLKGIGAKAKGGLGKIGAFGKGLLGKAKGGLGKIGAGLKGIGAKAKTGGKGLFGKIGAFGKGLLGKAKGGLGKIGAGLRGLGAKAKGGLGKIGAGIMGGLGAIKNTIKNGLKKFNGGKTPQLAPLSPAAQAANAKGKAFCAANCMINPIAPEKKCLDNGKLVPCKRCTGKPTNADPTMKTVCETVCNGNLPMSPCDFYGYVNNKKKTINIALLAKFGLQILRRK